MYFLNYSSPENWELWARAHSFLLRTWLEHESVAWEKWEVGLDHACRPAQRIRDRLARGMSTRLQRPDKEYYARVKRSHLPQYPELVSPPPKILNRFFLSATSAVCTFSALINYHHLHLQSIDTCLSIYRCQISLLHLLSLAYLLTCLQELAMRLLQLMRKI